MSRDAASDQQIDHQERAVPSDRALHDNPTSSDCAAYHHGLDGPVPSDELRSARHDEDNASDRVHEGVQPGGSDPTVRWKPPDYKWSGLSWGEQLIRQEHKPFGLFRGRLHDPHERDSQVREVYEQLKRENDPVALQILSMMNADEAAVLADRIDQRLATTRDNALKTEHPLVESAKQAGQISRIKQLGMKTRPSSWRS